MRRIVTAREQYERLAAPRNTAPFDVNALDPRIDQETLINNAISRYHGATPEELEHGRNWYQGARLWLQELANKTGGDYSRAAAIAAALSPQMSWDMNLDAAAHHMLGFDPNNPDIVPGLQTNEDRARAIRNGPDTLGALGTGPKINSFYHNFMGDDNHVTIDKHMLRALDRPYGADPITAYGGGKDTVARPENADDLRVKELEKLLGLSRSRKNPDGSVDTAYTGYNTYSDAMRQATQRINDGLHPDQHITPAQLQAIVWTQYKGDLDRHAESQRQQKWDQKNPGKPYQPPKKKPYVPAQPGTPMPDYTKGVEWAKNNPYKGGEERPLPLYEHGVDYGTQRSDNIPDPAPFKYEDMVGQQAMGTPGAMGSGLPTTRNRMRDPVMAAMEAVAFARQAIPNKITPEWEGDVFNHVMKQQYPGVTLHDQVGDAPTSGYMSSYPDHEEKIPFHLLTPQDISGFAEQHRDLINSDPNNYLGGWADEGQWYNDVSRNIQNPWEAAQQADKDNQLAVYDLNQDKGVDTPEMLSELYYKNTPGYHMAKRVNMDGSTHVGTNEDGPWIW